MHWYISEMSKIPFNLLRIRFKNSGFTFPEQKCNIFHLIKNIAFLLLTF